LNKTEDNFDIILLDRDCKAGGSFHVLDLEKYDPEKIIAISTYPEYNVEVVRRGVTKVARKDYESLEEWGDAVIELIAAILGIKNDKKT
jgi:hypothetical protein